MALLKVLAMPFQMASLLFVAASSVLLAFGHLYGTGLHRRSFVIRNVDGAGLADQLCPAPG
jgi:hypothetical protein